MSHSVVKDFPTQTDNTLILVVNKNGELSVDKETLDGYAKLGNSQVSILRVDNDDGSTVDMTLDTFHPTDTMEELTISVEDEIIRNYNSFRMDHCYTPLTSPSQQKPPIPPDHIDDDLELDDLAHTLSILDGTDPVVSKIKPKTNEHKDHTQKVELLNSDNNKVTLLNKVNKLGVNKVYKSVKTVLKGAKVIKKPELHPPVDSESEDDDDDDLNDSDFELDESPVKKQSRKPFNKRRSKLEHDLSNETRNKVVKVRKVIKPVYNKTSTPQKVTPVSLEPTPTTTPTPPPSTPEVNKSPETKKQPKKEKKIPKQIDDGIALFSTPDIIRRVGSGKSDNINAEELIPEDILYQVAKLVENPDVQNVIDRTLVDLEPTIQQAPLTEQQSVAVSHAHIVPSISVNQNVQVPMSNAQVVTPKNSPKPIQIVRSDGRVVTLPPIEKPATRSSKKKQETQVHAPVQATPPPPPSPPVQQPPQQVQPIVQPPVQHVPKVQPVPKAPKPLALPLADEFIVDNTAAGEGDTDSDESWNSEDDPDRLWCICKQPHNNRFMICCDTCEDWFHGKCVNVTKAMGQQMEQQGKEWQCPNCVKKFNTAVSSTSSIPNVSHPKPARVPPDSFAKRKSTESGPSCIVCSSPARANSVYCSDACILKHAQGVEKETNKAQKSASAPQRIIVFERSTGKCLSGPNAPTANNLKQWLREHPGFEVVRPLNNKAKQQSQTLVQSKLQLVKNPQGKDGVGLAVHRKGVQIGVLPHAAKQPNTIKLIPPTKMVPGAKPQTPKQQSQQSSPNKKLVQSTLKSPTTPGASTPAATPDKDKPKAPVTPTSKSKIRERKQKLQTPETPRQNAQENIRETVKKTLLEQLLARLKEVEDIKLGEEELDKMATEIETQLYKLFGDSGPKYRAKYRSLIFNIKDPKNQTLWRRICEKSISPHQLVRLSPEEMASQELARWREQENKHQLDMIKKSELEMLTINRKYVLKTHKGEQVMEDRPSVKVDSTEIMPGLGADSTSEHDTTLEKDKSDHNSDHGSERRSSSKHSRRDRDRDKRSTKDKEKGRDRDRDRDKEHKSSSSRSKRSRSHDRDKERERSSHKSDRKRSRSRDRHHRSSHKSSRHKRDKHSTEHLDKKSREILDNLENNKIVPPPEDRLWKHVPQQDIQEITPDSDSDHEPTSTVTIPTPPRSTEQEDSQAPKKEEAVIGAPPAAKPNPEAKAEMVAVAVASTRPDPRVHRDASVETPPESESSQPQTSPTLSSTNNSPAQATTTSTSVAAAAAAIWEGHINMADVAKFFISLHEVSGDCVGLDSELTSTLDIVGRITPETVWDYIGKMKRSNSKLISVLRLTAGNIEEQMQYIALFTYLSNRKRFGVIKTPNSAIKDFYIMPLASHSPIPQALLPLSGPGFKENRPDLLLGIVVRAKRKRPNPIDIISSGSSVKRSRLEDSPNINQTPISSAPLQQPPRSYTPPPTRDPRIRLPTIPPVAATLPNDDDEPYSPEDSDPETIPVILQKSTKPSITSVTSAAIAAASTINIKTGDISSVLSTTTKSTSFLEVEPFSNKFDGIPGLDEAPPTNAALIQKQLEELNKCIEQQKDEINSISQNLASTASTSVASNLSNINLPSNLQQILDSIKNIPSTNVAQDTEEYCPTAPGYKTAPSDTDDLTIPLMLPKLSSRTQSSRGDSSASTTIPLKLPVPVRETPIATESVALPNLSVPPPAVALPNTHIPPPVIPNLNVPPPLATTATIPLNLPKGKIKATAPSPPTIQPPGTSPVIIPDLKATSVDSKTSSSSVLSSLSEEELIRKAAEMLGEAEEPEKEDSPEPEKKAGGTGDGGKSQSVKCAPIMYTAPVVAHTPPKRTKIDPSQPPVPGLEDEFET